MTTFPCTVSPKPCKSCEEEQPIPCGEITNTQCPFPIDGQKTFVCVQSKEYDGRALQGTCVETKYIKKKNTHDRIIVWNGKWIKMG
jgi:hypothetical protein